MLIAIAITAVGFIVVIAAAVEAIGTARGTSTDHWMLHGPHSLH
jgi:hypothetical protein